MLTGYLSFCSTKTRLCKVLETSLPKTLKAHISKHTATPHAGCIVAVLLSCSSCAVVPLATFFHHRAMTEMNCKRALCIVCARGIVAGGWLSTHSGLFPHARAVACMHIGAMSRRRYDCETPDQFSLLPFLRTSGNASYSRVLVESVYSCIEERRGAVGRTYICSRPGQDTAHGLCAALFLKCPVVSSCIN